MPDELDVRLTAALAERYALERELGRGGMAVVYLARDLRHERRVALKVMRPEVAAGLGAERFLREIRIAAQLSHPHILPLFDSGEADGLLFYVMPFVEGESLRDRLVRERQLPLEEALRLGAEVAGALAYAHSHGVVHRDIKPENILLEGGHARVADFGIARAVHAAGGETLTETGLAVGTPAYMSPEQAAGAKELDARSDIYSLGCVLYEMLGGEVPYLGTTPQSIFAKKLSGPPPLLSALRDTVSPQLERVVEKALARSPADRWSGAQPLAEALLEAASAEHAEGTPARASRRTERRREWWRSWPSRALVGGLGVVVLGVAGTWAVRARRAAGLEPQRVVVAPFENATGDTAFNRLGRQAADAITQGLVQAEIPGLIASATALDSVAGEGQGSGDTRLRRLAKAAGAGIVVSGAYYRQGDTLRIQARIADVATGEIIAALAPNARPIHSRLDAVVELRQRVMAALAVHVGPGMVGWGAQASNPPLYDAYLAYQSGIAAIEGGDMPSGWALARSRFQRAFVLDSTFALALLWEGLAEWCVTLGSARLDSIIGRLQPMRERLSRAGQLRVDFLAALSMWDQERAYTIDQRLVALSGGGVWERKELALQALRTNRPREGVRVLQQIASSAPQFSPLGGGDYWGLLARGLHMLGDYRGELRAYQHGRAAGSATYHTTYAGLRSLAALGRYGELQQALDEAAARQRDPGWVGWYYMTAGTELMYHDQRDSGLAVIRRGIALLRAWNTRGSGVLEANRRGVLAYLIYYTGDWAGCAAEWGTLTQPRIVDEPPCPPWILAAHRSDRAEANRLLADADRRVRGNAALSRAWALMARARVAAILGDREVAMTYLRQAVPSIGFDLDQIVLDTDIDFDSLRDYPPFVELLRPKG